MLDNGLGRYEEALAAASGPCEHDDLGCLALGAGRAGRGGRPQRRSPSAPPAALRGSRSARRASRHRLGARHRGPVAGAAQRRRRGRGPLPRGDRAARPHPHRACTSPAPTWCTASGCGARAGASTPASSCGPPTRCSAHGRRGVRRARPPRAAGDRRDRAQAHRRDARRADRAGGADRPARRATGARTPRSAPSCSSAPAPSSGTCARCSPSSTSPPPPAAGRPRPARATRRLHASRRVTRRRPGGPGSPLRDFHGCERLTRERRCATTMSEQLPTIVLVHGAFAESASWNAVIERLSTEKPGRRDGHPSTRRRRQPAAQPRRRRRVRARRHRRRSTARSCSSATPTAAWSSPRPPPERRRGRAGLRRRLRARARRVGLRAVGQVPRQHPRRGPRRLPGRDRRQRARDPATTFHAQFAADVPAARPR